ncbi:GNAT family N-acetyltransferase [Chungangia koreensis]|uniref:GNAT family N-acetyltransferase n=1 Tax=Chungangia koreensis TaxID=752657 RepID=A0ABV8X0C5_9LACT
MFVKELTEPNEFEQAFPVMVELSDHLSKSEYLKLLTDMRKDGYRLFALYDDQEQIISLAGVAIRTDFFNGTYLWISEFVSRSEARSTGAGSILAEYLEQFAQSEGCEKIVLYSGISRERAHHFWESRRGFERRGIVFKKPLL